MEGNSSSSSINSSSTVMSDLQGLLEQLTGSKEPLPLSLLTYHQLIQVDADNSKEPPPPSSSEDTQQQHQHQQPENGAPPAAALKQAKEDALALFEKHIGPYQDVIDCATRHVEVAVDDGIMLFNTGNNRRWGGCPSIERYNHPSSTAFGGGENNVKGPRPDFCVWIGLFLGTEAEKSARQQYQKDTNNSTNNDNNNNNNNANHEMMTAAENGDDDEGDESSPPYTDVYHSLTNEVPKLNILELARNLLRYLREEESIKYTKLKDRWKLLRFCAVYGLSGAVTDVLAGRYGAVMSTTTSTTSSSTSITTKLTIDTPLPVGDEEEECSSKNYRRGGSYSYPGTLCFPVIGIASVLGYTHLVRHAHNVLGANVLDAAVTCRCFKTGNIIDSSMQGDYVLGTNVMDVENANILDKVEGQLPLARQLLMWSILKNQPSMVKCLVSDVGFQFRWLAQKEGGFHHDGGLKEIFKTLFLTDDGYRDDEGIWRGPKYDHEEYMWDRRKNRQALVKHSYRERQAMLKTLISLGMPKNLLVPIIDVSIDARLKQQARDQGLDLATKEMVQQVNLSMSRTEGKARGLIYEACAQYNQVVKRKDTLDMIDFYTNYISGLWNDHQANADGVVVQKERLPEYEALDPRWEMVAEKGEDEAFAPWWRSGAGNGGHDEDGESSSDEGGYNDSDDNGEVADLMVPIYHNGGEDDSNSDMEEDSEEESEESDDDDDDDE